MSLERFDATLSHDHGRCRVCEHSGALVVTYAPPNPGDRYPMEHLSCACKRCGYVVRRCAPADFVEPPVAYADIPAASAGSWADTAPVRRKRRQ